MSNDELPISSARMLSLLNGVATPETGEESIFLSAYGDGVQGISLKKCIDAIYMECIAGGTEMSDDEFSCLILGYMEGQEQYKEIDSKFKNELSPKSDKIH